MFKKYAIAVMLLILVVFMNCGEKEKQEEAKAEAPKVEAEAAAPAKVERLVSGDVAFGCARKEKFLKFYNAKNKKTREYKKALAKAIIMQECQSLKAGDTLIVVDSTSEEGAIQVKRKNGLFEFWTGKKAIK